jgi:g-D-glutamyl-meso-diaminopimelate peptidase
MNRFCFLIFILTFYTYSQEKSWENNKHYVVEDTVKYTYSMILDDLTYLYANFTNFVHPVSLGKSEFGLEISAIRLGNEVKKKNSVLFVGNIHAREDYSSKFVMKFLNIFLLNLIGEDQTYPNAKKILDSLDIYFIPVANPDGLKIAHLDFVEIKDSFAIYRDSILLIETFEEWKANGKGIDLNASFDDGNHHLKKGKTFHSVPCSEGFKGKFPAEPKETQALQEFLIKTKPLITASFHTKGNVIYWADKGSHKKFKGIDKIINDKICKSSGFTAITISKSPIIYGCGMENYIRAKLNRIASCVELSSPENNRKQFPDSDFNLQVWNKAWNIPYEYLENAILYKDVILKF